MVEIITYSTRLTFFQTGSVIGVKLFVDLEWTNGTRMMRVPSDRLQHIRPFRPGHFVVYGNWLGRVEDVRTIILWNNQLLVPSISKL
jgi:hypothetical protein